jgi:lipid-A-disaccharide synthase
MKYYIIAGEASGDLHASRLITQIHQLDKHAEIRAWGGNLMQAAGATIVKDYKDLAFMGFIEVVMHLNTIFKNISFCKKDITAFQPDVIVFIDYPGFNLRIAKWAKKEGFKTAYYISPQIWAWKENRIHNIKSAIDKMIVILPFEKNFYHKHHMQVDYVGHPLTEIVNTSIIDTKQVTLSDKPVIALLPGSRSQEIKVALPIMLQMVDLYPEYQFVIAQAPGQDALLYQTLIQNKNVALVPHATYAILKQAKAALVTSGTATLETALFGVPQIVCYKANSISYFLAKNLIKVKYISLVNLILDKPAVKELIQNDFNPQLLKSNLDNLLKNTEYQEKIQMHYAQLWEQLAKEHVSYNAANIIVTLTKNGITP